MHRSEENGPEYYPEPRRTNAIKYAQSGTNNWSRPGYGGIVMGKND